MPTFKWRKGRKVLRRYKIQLISKTARYNSITLLKDPVCKLEIEETEP